MLISKFCLVASLLLLASCGPAAPERARRSVLRRLRHELPPAAQPAPEALRVYDFPQDSVRYFSGEVPTFGEGGHLVTYAAPGPAAGAAPRRQAQYVAANDSAFYFLPVRHAAEFERRYHVPVPPPLP